MKQNDRTDGIGKEKDLLITPQPTFVSIQIFLLELNNKLIVKEINL